MPGIVCEPPLSEATVKSMKGNRGKDTGPELTLRKALWKAGIRGYRTNVRALPGKPDIVFGRAKLCVFVHGCFWHGCPDCAAKRRLAPQHNGAYWREKVEGNRERDARTVALLQEMGYRVIVVWECRLKRELEAVVFAISDARRA